MNINIHKLEDKINSKMIKLRKQSKFIEKGKISAIYPDYP
jgi:hypothetical protein